MCFLLIFHVFLPSTLCCHWDGPLTLCVLSFLSCLWQSFFKLMLCILWSLEATKFSIHWKKRKKPTLHVYTESPRHSYLMWHIAVPTKPYTVAYRTKQPPSHPQIGDNLNGDMENIFCYGKCNFTFLCLYGDIASFSANFMNFFGWTTIFGCALQTVSTLHKSYESTIILLLPITAKDHITV